MVGEDEAAQQNTECQVKTINELKLIRIRNGLSLGQLAWGIVVDDVVSCSLAAIEEVSSKYSFIFTDFISFSTKLEFLHFVISDLQRNLKNRQALTRLLNLIDCAASERMQVI